MEQQIWSTGLAQDSHNRIVKKCGPGDSLQEVACQGGGTDQADMVWSKMQILKEKYLPDMRDLYSILETRGQQPMPQEKLQTLQHYMTVLERMIPYLLAPKGGLPKEFQQDQMAAFEEQTASIMETFKSHKRQAYLGPPPVGQELQQAARILQPDNKLLQPQHQQQTSQMSSAPMDLWSDDTSNGSLLFSQSNVSSPLNVMGVAAQPNSLNSLATNGLHRGGHGDSSEQVACQAGGVDQADIVWSKMQTLKEEYLQDMRDLYSKFETRGQQPMPEEKLQKLKHYMTVLERMIPYLLAPKGGLPKEFQQDQMDAFERQLVSIMETFKQHKQQAYLGSSPAGQQEPQQGARILQPDNKLQQQTSQMNSAPMELQSDGTSNGSLPLSQSNVSSLPHARGAAARPNWLDSLANTAANSLHRGKMASSGQNSVNPPQVNIPAMQQQQQDRPSNQNRLLNDLEQNTHPLIVLRQLLQRLNFQ